jgi:hypothetical protein
MTNEDSSNAALTGIQMSSWFPIGIVRRVIFLFIIIEVAVGLLKNPHWYLLFLSFIAAIMSPRLVGEVAFLMGKIYARSSKK